MADSNGGNGAPANDNDNSDDDEMDNEEREAIEAAMREAAERQRQRQIDNQRTESTEAKKLWVPQSTVSRHAPPVDAGADEAKETAAIQTARKPNSPKNRGAGNWPGIMPDDVSINQEETEENDEDEDE